MWPGSVTSPVDWGVFSSSFPTLLVVGSAKLPQLDLLPAFLGFLLYKPALILQHVFDDR